MSALAIAQIVISIIVIGLILLQQRSSGAGSAFGGGTGESFYEKRRGMEKLVFFGTILSVAIFVIVSILKLVS